MNIFSKHFSSIVMGCFSFFVLGCQSHQKPNNKPNVIIILTDDLGYADVGFNGSLDIRTPHIDRIAKNGVQFTNGYVSYAVCGPSRAGLITGRYQDQFGFSRNPLFAPKDESQGLPLSEQTMAEALHTAGYKTMAIGKWHLGAHKTQRPLARGFDEFFGFLSGGHKYFPEEWTKNDISEVSSQFDAYNTKILKNNTRIDEQEYLTDAFSREAVNFVKANAKQPFFLYLAYNAPHTPLEATEKYLSRYPEIKDKKRKTFAAMVSAVDDGVGTILNTLKDLNIEDNTIIFFLSDNGGNESKGANNGPLREGKGWLYEGGIRVPFAMQWPAVIPKEQKFHDPVISFDIFATVAAQAEVTPKNELNGVNLIPYVTGKLHQAPHQALFWRHYDRDAFAVRTSESKYVKDRNGKAGLFNINDDISEKSPLADPLKIQDLKADYMHWNEKNIPPQFDGLLQNKDYNKTHPNRFKNVEKY
ncbi:sulfatase-like hydrolase/transferase [Gaetbulibacter aestuarii]|uniref:Sulfatase-like hydrolase/transferase n=1 Tax=Gaetbulibacter aestuarii TaxID=1502358 RepID=A0ABW7MZT7_9FLAO